MVDMADERAYRGGLRVAIVCPAPAGSRLGNRVTAERWQRMIDEIGHHATIVDRPEGADVLVALHAGKSADAVRASRDTHPHRPIVLALTGTDLYRDIHQDEQAMRSLDLADRLVVLHQLAPLDVPERFRDRVRVIRQSAEPPDAATLAAAKSEARDRFDVAFVAHARIEKDPLRPALAARRLPESSRLRVLHAGRALSNEIEAQLVREANENPRYVWLGERPEAEARALIARSALLVLTSRIEGGANVLGEAIVAGTPPLASRIGACVAALGGDYPGLFEAGDTDALAGLFARAEADRSFHDELAARSRARRSLFDPAAERDAWRSILAEVATGRVL
jgi:putative glycosyltransferase (TIGR04348 family)